MDTHSFSIPEHGNPAANDIAAFQSSILHYLKFTYGKELAHASADDIFQSVSLALREYLIDSMIATSGRYERTNAKKLYYLSTEFLLGRSLGNNLINLGLMDLARESLLQLEINLEEIQQHESEALLGNGGLGRLAACFLDSLATLNLPGYGYGLNYEFGLFRQEITDGQQNEKPNRWSAFDCPWLISSPCETFKIPIYGKINHIRDTDNNYFPTWTDFRHIIGRAHDMPIAGYGGKTVNYLRLFSARSSDEFDRTILTDVDYYRAVNGKISNETITKILYPADSDIQEKEHRLVQEYFLVSCSIQDIIKKHRNAGHDITSLAEMVSIQINDTNTALAGVELMRILLDDFSLDWDTAWKTTVNVCGYTNHTLIPEALEKWSVSLLERVIPRHMQIIYEINHRFLKEVQEYFPDDENAPTRMSLIEEAAGKKVNMAHLAIVGSHSVNGVALMHSRLMRTSLFPDFHDMYPERFSNKTNGITPRRWLIKANPLLSELITKTIGTSWVTNLDHLTLLEQHISDSDFCTQFRNVKQANKQALAELITTTTGLQINPKSLFDVHIKRIHEYKRQLLNVMNIIHTYLSIIEDKDYPQVPRVHIFAGKAAPGYTIAKLIIRLINNVADVINNDKRVKDYIRVVMLPDFNVSLAEKIAPAADLSEQISTAGMEASGTGNMKLSMNGALTIGTLDGSNIEIMEEVGAENFFMFGLNVEQIEEIRDDNNCSPWDYYANNPTIRRVMDCLDSEMFCQENPGLFKPIYNSIMEEGDYFFYLPDLQDYIDTQKKVSHAYQDSAKWTEMAIRNVARMGRFSSDRTIRQYAEVIWRITPVE
ncbi:glycogen/starch/alpha-glucan phosphorylase [Desulfosediminicola flagellatus]|uniref:glycogen/starch/alpha-glucan phosphorylase n=1 Tax=Desulfosediminicola flagellatus TaxID=2569541 RepID=UPI0010AD6252|nr:glycogen/starch/alpha-glucan phosphorylase [Desulfosediminicola flagellatus]